MPLLVRMYITLAVVEISIVVPQHVKLEPYEPSVPLLGIVSTILHRCLLANVYSTIHDVKAGSQSMHPSTDVKIMKTWHIHRRNFT